jgi:hypothetical protein
VTSIFRWYVARPDGTADCYTSDPPSLANAYGTPEGAIKHGGVQATAFIRKTEEVFDAVEAIIYGRRVSAGFRTTTKVTA